MITASRSPSDELKQIAADSTLAKELVGKKVDETFQIAPGFMERRGIIRQIVHSTSSSSTTAENDGSGDSLKRP